MKLIIFDCDGVLVDSEALACHIEAECLTAAGFPTTTQDILARYLGRSEKFLLADIEARHGKALPADFSTTALQELDLAFQAELRPVPGMRELVGNLNGPRCIASSSSIRRIQHSLTVTDLLPLFDPYIFSASMVARGKPAPDLFLHAASEMNVRPEDCLVVEDAAPGIQGAKAAGMEVIGFLGGAHRSADDAQELSDAGADTIAGNTEELKPLLRAR